MTIRQPRATLIQFGIATLGFVGIPASSFLPHTSQKIVAAICLFLLFSIAVVKNNKCIVHLKTTCPKFDKYFKNWYSKQGTLHVYCSELDWLKPESDTFRSLEEKAKVRKLLLYLKTVTETAKALEAKGAKIFTMPDLIVGEPKHKFSLLENDGHYRIICRSKLLDVGGEDVIQFVSTTSSNDPHLVALAREALQNCGEFK